MGEAKFRARRSATPGTAAISSLLRCTSLHDHRSKDEAAHRSPQAAMVRPPEFVCCDAQTLSAIRSLPRSSNLVLFAPVVPPEPEPVPAEGAVQEPPGKHGSSRADADAPMDPFEPLGRALSRHHSRVRHVPYVPSVGMTTTHQTFLEHAAAVVLVVACNRSNRSHPRPRFSPASGSNPPAHQQQAQQYGDRYHSLFSSLPPLRRSPVTPTRSLVKADRNITTFHGTILESVPFDPAFRFALQALTVSWDLEQQRSAGGEPVPVVVLLVDERQEAEFELERVERLTADLVAGWHSRNRPRYSTVVSSGGYSARALRAAAELVFESEL